MLCEQNLDRWTSFSPKMCSCSKYHSAHVFFTIAGKSGWPSKNAFTLVTAYASIKLFFANWDKRYIFQRIDPKTYLGIRTWHCLLSWTIQSAMLSKNVYKASKQLVLATKYVNCDEVQSRRLRACWITYKKFASLQLRCHNYLIWL